MNKENNKKYIKKISYILYLFLSTFFLIEFTSRIFLPQPIRTTSTFLHSDGLLTNKNTGSSLHSLFGLKPIRYKYGSLYSRVNNQQLALGIDYKNNNYCNLLILGDSSTFGWLMPDYKHFVDILQNEIIQKYGKTTLLHNSSVGGSALSYYEAFTKKFKREIYSFDGIIVFLNSNDISDSEYNRNFGSYSFSDSSNSRIIFLKKLIDNKYISVIHNFLIGNFNIIRIFKNLVHTGKVYVDGGPNNNKKTNQNLNNADNQIKLDEEYKNYLTDLIKDFSNNTKTVPLNLIYIGDKSFEKLPIKEKLFYGKWGKDLLEKNNIYSDFSLLNNSPVYDLEYEIIKGDGHPNSKGHQNIATAIKNSISQNSFLNFTKKVCKK